MASLISCNSLFNCSRNTAGHLLRPFFNELPFFFTDVLGYCLLREAQKFGYLHLCEIGLEIEIAGLLTLVVAGLYRFVMMFTYLIAVFTYYPPGMYF
jgi:hypothetical protein